MVSISQTNRRRRPVGLRVPEGRLAWTRRPGARKGALLSVELLFVLPILLGLIFGMVEFSLLFSAKQQIKTASRLACRLGTLPATDPARLEQAVREAVEQGLVRPSLIGAYEYRFQPGQFTGDEVVAEVRVPMKVAAPDLLAPIGFNLKGRHLTARTVMRKE